MTDAQPLTAERIAEIEPMTSAANSVYPTTREGYFALQAAREEFEEKATDAIADLLCEVERLRTELTEASDALDGVPIYDGQPVTVVQGIRNLHDGVKAAHRQAADKQATIDELSILHAREKERVDRLEAELAALRAGAIEHAVAEYSLHHARETNEALRGRRNAVRGMMVRLGLYEQFNNAIGDEAAAPQPQKEGE